MEDLYLYIIIILAIIILVSFYLSKTTLAKITRKGFLIKSTKTSNGKIKISDFNKSDGDIANPRDQEILVSGINESKVKIRS